MQHRDSSCLQGGRTLVGAIELVSPGNKDRPVKRRLLAAKCATYLSRSIGYDRSACHNRRLVISVGFCGRCRRLWGRSGALDRRLAVIIVLATIPGAVAGLLFGKYIEEHVRWPLLIAATTAFWGLVMLLADRQARPSPAPRRTHSNPGDRPDDPLEHVGWGQGIAVGFAQALALIPGTSRSGITITTGLLTGLDRATAARYAFLLGIPITAGAGMIEALHLLRTGEHVGDAGPILIAILVSFLSGWFAVWFLVNYLKRRSLVPFVIYRLVLAAVIVAVWYR